MFPNLRLMLSASLAIIVLVAIVGSSLVLFRPPPARMVDMPESVRPVMPIADDSRPTLRVDASTRRNDELQRLLALPSGPARAYAAEPPATFPYEVTTAVSTVTADATATTSVDAPPAIATAAIAAPATAAPAIASSPPAEPESIEAAVTPAPVVAALPEPTGQPEPAAVAAAEPTEPLVTGSSRSPDTTASTAAPVPGIEAVPVSSIPAVDDAPIPRPKPQLALADPKAVAEQSDAPQAKVSQPHRVKAKARPRRHATPSRRAKRPLPPPTAFESQQGQFLFFDNNAGRNANVDGRQGDGRGRSESAGDQANSGRAQRQGYAIRPPTASSR